MKNSKSTIGIVIFCCIWSLLLADVAIGQAFMSPYIQIGSIALLTIAAVMIFCFVQNSRIENQNKYIADTIEKNIAQSIDISKQLTARFDDVQKIIMTNYASVIQVQTQLQKDIANLDSKFSSSIEEASHRIIDTLDDSKTAMLSTIQIADKNISQVRDNVCKVNDYIHQSIDEVNKKLDSYLSEFKRKMDDLSKVNSTEIDKAQNAICEKIKDSIMGNEKGRDTIISRINGNIKVVDNVIEEIKKNNKLCGELMVGISEISTSTNSVQNIITKRIETISSLVLHSQNEGKELAQEIRQLQNLVNTISSGFTSQKSTVNVGDKYSSKPKDWVDQIKDPETKNVVENHYTNDELIKSVMRNNKGTVIYEVEYNSMNIVKSRSYDENGNPTVEQTYHHNGQVSSRYEFATKKKTSFDINGNKL